MIDRASHRAFDWIDAHADDFSFSLDDSADRQLLLMKPFSELILTLHLLKRSFSEQDRINGRLTWAWNKLEGGDVFFRLLVARPDLYQLSLPIALLNLHSFSSHRVLQVIDEISRLRAFLKFETERWVTVSVAYAYHLLGKRSLTIEDFGGCWLQERPEPWLMTNAAAYALTHEIFYLTNFGHDQSKVSPEILAYIDCWGPAWLSFYEQKADWDLFSEFIIVGQCLDLPWANSALRILAANQLPDGSVPGPPKAGLQLVHDADSDQRRAFLSKYHTTLVATLALTQCCNPTRRGRFSFKV